MSYEPEIVIGSDKAVLERICDPFTKVVSYAPTEQEWRVPFKLIDEFQAAVVMQPRLEASAKHIQRLTEALGRWGDRVYGEQIDALVADFVKPQSCTPKFEAQYFPVGQANGDACVPHLDYGVLSAFLQFSAHMDGTHFIPARFAHGRIQGGKLVDADVNQAVAVSGVSLTIAKISEVGHFAPPLPENQTHPRILLSRRYWALSSVEGDFFPFKAL